MSPQTAPAKIDTGTTDVASLVDELPDESQAKPIVSALLEVIEEQGERIDELERRISNTSDSTAGAHERVSELESTVEHANEYAHDRIDRIEYELDGETPGVEAPEDASKEPKNGKSPLEDVTNYPEHVVEEQLSTNQQRARFVARDITDYATKSPKGYVISSSEIAQVLTVRDGESPHTETTSRVMDFLDTLGKGETYLKTHKGRKLVVFDDVEAAERYGKGRLDVSRGDVIPARTTG